MTSTRLSSRSLSSVAYRPELELLRIEFTSGEVYYYSGVPEAVHSHLLHAESKGRYFNQSIRNHVPYEKANAVPKN